MVREASRLHEGFPFTIPAETPLVFSGPLAVLTLTLAVTTLMVLWNERSLEN